MIKYIISIFVAVATSFFTEHLLLRVRGGHFVKERYLRALSPIMREIDPFINKAYLSKDELRVAEECKKIVEENYAYTGGKLLYYFSLDFGEKYNFKNMCRCLESSHRKACKALGIPPRPYVKWKRNLGALDIIYHVMDSFMPILMVVTLFLEVFLVLCLLEAAGL